MNQHELKITIDIDDAEQLKTVGDVVELVDRLIG